MSHEHLLFEILNCFVFLFFQLGQFFNMLLKKAIGTRVEPTSWICLASGTAGSKPHLLPSAYSCLVELDGSPVFNSNTSCDRKSIRR